MSEKRLLVIDGHSLAFRAFYAMKAENFLTASGVYTNAVYGFTSMLCKMIEVEKPTHVAAAFDLSRRSFRTEIYPEYKGGRGETPEEFIGQVELIQQMLEAMGVKWLTMEDMEADDILATLAARGEAAGFEVLVVSGDRDTFQLVNDSVTVLYPGKSVTEPDRKTPQAILDQYQVPPQRYPEIAALTGESADNLPGVPLVGPKTAAEWINKYDGLDNLLDHAAEIGGKRGENLRAHLEDVRRNRRLNALLRDLDLPLTLEDLAWEGADKQAVYTLCDKLEFNNIRNRIMQLRPLLRPGQAAEEAALAHLQAASAGESALEIHLVPGQVTVGQMLSDIGTEVAQLWVEGRWDALEGEVDYLALQQGSQAWIIDPVDLASEEENQLGQWLEGEGPKVVFDAKGYAHALAGRGWKLGGVKLDVQLADCVANADARRGRLGELRKVLSDVGQRLLGAEYEAPAELGRPAQLTLLDLPEESVESRVRLEGLATLARDLGKMAGVLRQQIAHRQVDGVLEEIEMPLVPILTALEQRGIAADRAEFGAYLEDLAHEVEAAQSAAYEAIGREVNLSSPKQLQEVLFEQLKMPPTKKTKTGYTTNADALEELSISNPHPFLSALLAHRDYNKLLQIVTGLVEHIGADGRIHTTYQQAFAATGRMSSAEPNLQNIPARTENGLRLRQGFVAGEGYDGLLTADYSQIEMRIMAHLSGDEALIEAFNSGEDLHRSVAAMVFGIDPGEVTATQRSHIKATSYGLAYGLSAFGLSKQLRISNREAKELMDTYFARFGKVKEYLDEIVKDAARSGYTETMYGRRRYFPDLRSTNRQLQEAASRAALNAPIQGSAADLIKLAMIRVQAAIAGAGLRSRMLLQVHDELVFEVVESEVEELQTLVRQAMGEVAQLRVPLEVSVGYGANWRAAAH